MTVLGWILGIIFIVMVTLFGSCAFILSTWVDDLEKEWEKDK